MVLGGNYSLSYNSGPTSTAKNKILVDFVDTEQKNKNVPAEKESKSRIKNPVNKKNLDENKGELK